MGLKINGSTSGSIEIDVPAVAGTDTSITIPAKNGGTFIVEESTGNIDLGPLDINGSASDDSVVIDSAGNVGINETSPSTFNDAGTGGVNFVLGASGSGRGVLTFASEQTGGTDEPLGIINFVDSDTTNTATRGARIIGHRGSDANTAYLKFETADSGSPTERMRIKQDGRIVVGGYFTTSYGQVFTAVKADDNGMYFGIGDQGNSANAWSRVSGTSTITHIQFANPNGSLGSITTNGSSTAYNTSSDYRLKENVVDLDGAINRVKQLAPKRFNFISDETDTLVDGFLAHEAQVVVPEAVTGTKDEVEVWKEGEELPDGVSVGDNKLDEDGNTIPKYQGIDQAKLVPLLTAALQEAIGKIETLETANASLEARLTALEGGAS